MMRTLFLLSVVCFFGLNTFSQSGFNGLEMNMGNLYMISNAESRSVSPENFTGEKGKGGMAKPEDKDIPNRANGHFVGVYMAWGVHNKGWWGEGEIKFFIDGDRQFPTICGTGAEDYFCGSYGFYRGGQYKEYCTPYAGLHQVIRPDGTYQSQQRFGLYRWHIMDPVRFKKDLKITMQDLGWRHGGRYLLQNSDISPVCFWYQTEPHAKFPDFPDWQNLEVN